MWKTVLMVNNHVIPLNSFIQNYIGNILWSVCFSLGRDCKDITLFIEDEIIKIHTETGEIPLTKKFAKDLICCTVKGVLTPLKEIFWLQKIAINSRLAEKEVIAWCPVCENEEN